MSRKPVHTHVQPTAVATAIARQQLAELRQLLPTIYAGVALCVGLLTAVFFHRAPISSVLLGGAGTLVIAARAFAWRRMKIDALSPQSIRDRLRTSHVAAVLAGVVCAAVAFGLDRIATPSDRIVLILVAAFCGIGGGMSLAATKSACRWFMILSTAPFSAYVALSGDMLTKVTALIVLAALPVGLKQYSRIADFIVALTNERFEAERHREHAVDSLRAFMEMASDWAWETDADHRLTYISDKVIELLGEPPSALIGLKTSEAFGASFFAGPPEERAFLREALNNRQNVRAFAYAIHDVNGSIRTVATTIRHFYDADGSYQGARGWTSDITERIESRKAIEAANVRLEQQVARRTAELASGNELLNEVIETMSTGLCVFDADGKIEISNSKTAAASGLPAECWRPGADVRELLALGVSHGLYHFKSVDDYERAMNAALDATGAFVAVRRQRDGRVIAEQASRRKAGGCVMTYSDVTDAKQREKELEDLSAALLEAKNAAISASKAKTEFLANMSHEIRTPMNGVIGMATLLQESGLTSAQREMADVIVNSGESLLRIINDILDFSRLEAGKLATVSEPFNLRAAIDDVAALLNIPVQEKGLELLIRYSPELGDAFVGDVGRVRQVITNLLGNAVKFTEAGHVLIAVDGERRGEIADVVITVEDTGCGVPPQKLDAIFAAFEQVDGAATRRHDGTGLGLAITKRLVQAMNGQISAESALGEGSKFQVRLPLRIDETALGRDRSLRIDVDGARALIVDDNKVNRDILREQLTSWGFSPFVYGSADAALDAAAEAAAQDRPFDVAIVDHHMPGTDGVGLARRLRATPATRLTPLILLTSAGRKGDAAALRDGLFDAYLVKPARASLLFDALVASLESRARENASIAAAALRGAAPNAGVDPASPLSALAQSGPMLNVLVAEDNVVNQMVIRSMLERLNCNVTLASDGRDAIRIYEERDFDIVLMDISMPDMDGVEATRRIRAIQDKLGSRRPIIGVTAHAMPADRNRCLDAGMDDYLPKPVKKDAIAAMLGKWAEDPARNGAAAARSA